MVPKKPPTAMALKVVPIAGTAPAPPADLGEAGADLWRSILGQYHIEDAGGLAMLQQACRAADRAHECSAIIAADGPVVSTAQGVKDHPLLRHEMTARAFVVRTICRLGLDVEPVRPSVGRPPGGRGW